jgi:hypothetical protein
LWKDPINHHTGVPPHAVIADSSPSLQTPTIVGNLEKAIRTGDYRVIVKRGTKKISLFSFLLSSLYHDPEGLDISGFLTLFHLYQDLIELNDPLFLEKKNFLESKETQEFLSSLQDVKIFPVHIRDKKRELLAKVSPILILSSRGYFGQKFEGRLGTSYRLCLRHPVLKRKFPPKPYIGVGYKDKGSRRNKAEDGSPGWQEIASYHSSLEGMEEDQDSPGDSSGKPEELT